MSYTITNTDNGEAQIVETRADVVRALGSMGYNHYVATRLLDVADGIMPLDMPRPVTVVLNHADARGWDTRPGSLRNEAPDGDAAYLGPQGAQTTLFDTGCDHAPRRITDFYLDGSPVYVN